MHGLSLFETSKPFSTVTHFIQQGHTYSKVTPPDSATPFWGHFLSSNQQAYAHTLHEHMCLIFPIYLPGIN